MIKFRKYVTPIKGDLEIDIDFQEDEFEGEIEKWQDVLIHGDPEGLRSLAEVLIKMANLDQKTVRELPVGAKEHIHLRPKFDLSKNSVQVIVGRLDAKGTGEFHKDFIPRDLKDINN